jgi:hypothetical protein
MHGSNDDIDASRSQHLSSIECSAKQQQTLDEHGSKCRISLAHFVLRQHLACLGQRLLLVEIDRRQFEPLAQRQKQVRQNVERRRRPRRGAKSAGKKRRGVVVAERRRRREK